MREASRSALREWYDQLDARLDAGGGPEQRAALRDEVVALFRAVEREITALTALKEEIRALVAKWRDFGPRRGCAAAGSREPVPSRADLIGATTHVEKGWARLSVGDFASAVESLSRAAEMAPEDHHAATLLAWAETMQGQHEAAATRLTRVLALQPANALARMLVGYIRFREGRFADAIGNLWRAILLDNDRKATLYAHYFLGLVYADRALHRDAQQHFRTSLEFGPNLIEAEYHLGLACWRSGDADGAREAWRKGSAARKFNPWGTRCADALATVDAGGEPSPPS